MDGTEDHTNSRNKSNSENQILYLSLTIWRPVQMTYTLY